LLLTNSESKKESVPILKTSGEEMTLSPEGKNSKLSINNTPLKAGLKSKINLPNTETPCGDHRAFSFFFFNYSALGASTGQAPAQEPQSMQASASITYFPSPSEIASTGHSLAHAPQAMQSSLIMYAISIPSSFDLLLLYHNY
jgi:hypothetical protein